MSHSQSTSLQNVANSGVESGPWGEWLLIAAITLGGGLLRAWQPAHMAVEHFDEGVYASNLYCYALTDGAGYPFRHLYAPPLFPAMLEWVLILTGSSAAVMWVNVIAGTATIPSLWWVGRSWFGPMAGLCAAAFAALSPLHVLYSRAALTDVPLCLWMLWGVYWSWRGIWNGRPAALILAGAFTALAWWTKYNGWLTLAISGAGTLAWIASSAFLKRHAEQRSRAEQPASDWDSPSAGQALARWAITAAVAVLFWIPVPLALRDVGGYETVSTNHARYFVGPAGWPTSFVRQVQVLAHYHPPPSWMAVVLITAAILLVQRASSETRHGERVDSPARSLAGWMVTAWFVGLLVAVPLYTPYPRLVLPWLAAAWLVTGWGVAIVTTALGKRLGPSPGPLHSQRGAASGSVARTGAPLLLVAAMAVAAFANHRLGIREDRRQFQKIASHILKDSQVRSRDGRPLVVMVLGEPGLFYHLAAALPGHHRRDAIVVLPVASYPTTGEVAAHQADVFLVAGPHASPLAAEPPEIQQRLDLVEEFTYAPSDLVLLDDHGVAILNDRAHIPSEQIRLYRVLP